MKKLILGIFLMSSIAMSAQELGIRFGQVSGKNNVAVDGIFETGPGRIHANVSFGDGVGLDALSIGIDYRPTFWIVEDTEFEWGGFGLNIRYRFN